MYVEFSLKPIGLLHIGKNFVELRPITPEKLTKDNSSTLDYGREEFEFKHKMYYLSVEIVLHIENKSNRTIIFLCLPHCSLKENVKKCFLYNIF